MGQPILLGKFGDMGSGKTYDAMANDVIPAIKARQKICTNIKGLLPEDKLENTSALTGVSVEEIKQLITLIPNLKDDLFHPVNWPKPTDWEKLPREKWPSTLITPGCLLIIDECSTIFNKEPPEHVMRYLTEQRHGVDQLGNTGRTVLISQSPKMHHSVRAIMGAAFEFQKFTGLGPVFAFIKKHNLPFYYDYRIKVYTDKSKTIGRSKPDTLLFKRFDTKIFDCYKSQSQAEFKELTQDKRLTVLGNKYVMVFAPIAIAVACYSGYHLLQKFTNRHKKEEAPQAQQATGQPQPPAAKPSAFNQATQGPAAPQKSDEYSLLGQYHYGRFPAFVLLNNKTKRTEVYVLPEVTSYVQNFVNLELILKDGTKLSYYTNQAPQQQEQKTGEKNEQKLLK